MKTLSKNSMYLSIVIPVFNEEANISPLLHSLHSNLQPLDINYEIILVDDGSSDSTWEKINIMSQTDASFRGIRLTRNFGHQHALLAGLSHAKGTIIVSMDGDLQHPPALIKDLIAKYNEGYKVVNTCREDTEVTSFFKRTSSSCFYKIFSILTDVPMAKGLSDFRLFDRDVLDHLLELKDVDLFLRGAVEWLGFRSTTVPYTAEKRFSGTSKYSLSKMIKFARGSVISFSTKPLILGVWLGIVTSTLSFLEIVYILFQVSTGQTVSGWASTVGIISFLFGILFIILGIIGTYIARIHVALQNRPRFLISEFSKTSN